MNILLTAKQRGSVNVLAPVARELFQRGHDATIYATGNEIEAAGFSELEYKHIHPADSDYSKLVKNYDAVVVGLSGYDTSDGHFLRAANSAGIPTVAVQDQNSNYLERLGVNPADLPTLLALMSDDCVKTARKELGGEMGEEAGKRSRVVGWTAFDNYAKMREDFTDESRVKLLAEVGINPENPVYVHFTQTIHPNTVYMAKVNRLFGQKVRDFLYELGVTQFTFEAASDSGLKLVVKPHPGEEFDRNYTKELANRHGFTFIPARGCNTQQLMLAAYSVTAGRSTCLTESTLLDRNTGGLIPDLGEEWVSPFSPLALGAIPYAQNWEGIKNILEQVTSKDEEIVRKLAEDRKKFSVDGKASKRLADLVESLI
ncbi:MAG: hypothetical protein AABW48_05250 [Nanoarchaeota archaeon]